MKNVFLHGHLEGVDMEIPHDFGSIEEREE